jgi:hypothetical protein
VRLSEESGGWPWGRFAVRSLSHIDSQMSFSVPLARCMATAPSKMGNGSSLPRSLRALAYPSCRTACRMGRRMSRGRLSSAVGSER